MTNVSTIYVHDFTRPAISFYKFTRTKPASSTSHWKTKQKSSTLQQISKATFHTVQVSLLFPKEYTTPLETQLTPGFLLQPSINSFFPHFSG